MPTHRVEDVWDVLLGGGLADVAKLRRVQRGNQAVVSDQSHALVGHLVADQVDLIGGVPRDTHCHKLGAKEASFAESARIGVAVLQVSGHYTLLGRQQVSVLGGGGGGGRGGGELEYTEIMQY